MILKENLIPKNFKDICFPMKLHFGNSMQYPNKNISVRLTIVKIHKQLQHIIVNSN